MKKKCPYTLEFKQQIIARINISESIIPLNSVCIVLYLNVNLTLNFFETMGVLLSHRYFGKFRIFKGVVLREYIIP